MTDARVAAVKVIGPEHSPLGYRPQALETTLRNIDGPTYAIDELRSAHQLNPPPNSNLHRGPLNRVRPNLSDRIFGTTTHAMPGDDKIGPPMQKWYKIRFRLLRYSFGWRQATESFED